MTSRHLITLQALFNNFLMLVFLTDGLDEDDRLSEIQGYHIYTRLFFLKGLEHHWLISHIQNLSWDPIFSQHKGCSFKSSNVKVIVSRHNVPSQYVYCKKPVSENRSYENFSSVYEL